jgi:dipeptidyl aminopeptidase/acylaminoacyl peptidase
MPDFASVESYQLSPDGRYVVFLADRETDGVLELYRASITGGEGVRLNATLVPGAPGIYSFKISPDSRYVVFITKPGLSLDYELHSVPIEGGGSTRLSNNTPPDEVMAYEISPDSQRVLYTTAPGGVGATFDLYTIPISGGISPVKLNDLGFRIINFRIAPDSSRVVMRCLDSEMRSDRLYSVLISGGGTVLLNSDDLDDVEEIRQFDITPDSQKVVFISNLFASTDDLYANPITSVHSQQITIAPPGPRWGVNIFAITPNSLGVVFAADFDNPGVNELYSVSIDGGGTYRLNKDLVAGGEAFDYYTDGFKVTPNSQRVVFRADQDMADRYELYSVSVFGGTNTRLNASLPAGGQVRPGFRLTPNGLGVVYLADQENVGKVQLYSVWVTGGIPYHLSQPMIDQGDAISFRISPNNQVVVYTADKDEDEQFELYSVLINGGPSLKLNGDLPSGGDVNGPFFITPNSLAVVYRADQDRDEKFELYLTTSAEQIFLPLIIR